MAIRKAASFALGGVLAFTLGYSWRRKQRRLREINAASARTAHHANGVASAKQTAGAENAVGQQPPNAITAPAARTRNSKKRARTDDAEVQEFDGGVSARPHTAPSDSLYLREQADEAYEVRDPEDMWEKFLARATQAAHQDSELERLTDLEVSSEEFDDGGSTGMSEASLRDAQGPDRTQGADVQGADS